MSLSIISFYAAGVIGLVSALVVASSLNPVHRIAFLILVFLSGSFLMILLDFYFLGLTYIIVYVGAIMILFLFVIMMVQIHLMPVTTSIAPRILNNNIPNSKTSALNTQVVLPERVLGSIDPRPDTPYGVNHYLSEVTLNAVQTPLVYKDGYNTLSLSTIEVARPHTPNGVNEDSYSNVSRIRKGGYTSFISFYILLVPLLSLYIFTLINPTFWNQLIGSHYTGYNGGNMIVNYFFPSWFVEFKTMTDLETLANILYLGYPTALLLVGVALWAVLIGIIKITASKA